MGMMYASNLVRAADHLARVLDASGGRVHYSRFYDGTDQTAQRLYEGMGLDTEEGEWIGAEGVMDEAAASMEAQGFVRLVWLEGEKLADGASRLTRSNSPTRAAANSLRASGPDSVTSACEGPAMLNKLKRRILKAVFAHAGDRGPVVEAASEAAERILHAHRPYPSGAAEADAWDAAFVAVLDAIKRYQELRAGPPDRPKPAEPPRRTPRRPLRERGRTVLARFVRRVRMAARVLFLGHRPARVGYDFLDRRIAENCSFWIADIIAGRYSTPHTTIDEDDDLCRKIAWLVYEAIEAYVTYATENEAVVRMEVQAEERRRREGETGWPNG